MANEINTTPDDSLIKASVHAAATIQAFYQWIDMIEDAGGCGSIAGIAKANAFVKSMNANRARLDKLVLEPIHSAIAKAQVSA